MRKGIWTHLSVSSSSLFLKWAIIIMVVKTWGTYKHLMVLLAWTVVNRFKSSRVITTIKQLAKKKRGSWVKWIKTCKRWKAIQIISGKAELISIRLLVQYSKMTTNITHKIISKKANSLSPASLINLLLNKTLTTLKGYNNSSSS
jgi:hypothetical protein